MSIRTLGLYLKEHPVVLAGAMSVGSSLATAVGMGYITNKARMASEKANAAAEETLALAKTLQQGKLQGTTKETSLTTKAGPVGDSFHLTRHHNEAVPEEGSASSSGSNVGASSALTGASATSVMPSTLTPQNLQATAANNPSSEKRLCQLA
jgi:hypothetical protein